MKKNKIIRDMNITPGDVERSVGSATFRGSHGHNLPDLEQVRHFGSSEHMNALAKKCRTPVGMHIYIQDQISQGTTEGRLWEQKIKRDKEELKRREEIRRKEKEQRNKEHKAFVQAQERQNKIGMAVMITFLLIIFVSGLIYLIATEEDRQLRVQAEAYANYRISTQPVDGIIVMDADDVNQWKEVWGKTYRIVHASAPNFWDEVTLTVERQRK